MNVLVLGGNGFIGSHFVDVALLENHTVRVLSRKPEVYRKPVKGVDYRFGGFSDEKLLSKALDGVDLVFHSISSTVPFTSNKDPKFDVKTNLANTITLLELMVKQGVKRIVFVSSGGTIYGNPSVSPTAESYCPNPLSSYAIVKLAIENYLQLFQKLHGLNPLIIRPSNVYGPRHGHLGIQGVISTFLYKIMNKQPIEIWGDGTAVRDYLYIDDFIELCAAAAFSNKTGIFNAGAGQGHSLLDILKVIYRVTDTEASVVFKKSVPDVEKIVLDISKAKKTFGWKPVVPLEEGVTKVWNWMKAIPTGTLN